MPRVKSMPKKRRGGAVTTAMGRRVGFLGRRMYRRAGAPIRGRFGRPKYTINTASVKETYSIPIADGNVVFVRNTQLADLAFDRSQNVARAYQQFRVKYVKLTFQPAADTFPVVAGNVIPQLYWMIDKTNSIPLNADANTFFSMGARPHRMDNKNLTFAYKPSALSVDLIAPGVTTASQLRISPWLSTNANSGNPVAAWAPSEVDHLGCAFYVTKINPGDTLQYTLNVEVVFEFRKPLWIGSASQTTSNLLLEGDKLTPVPSIITGAPQEKPSGV